MKHKEEFITEEKVINTPAGGVLIGKDKQGQTIIPNDGSLGGFLIGRTHDDGGIKAINKGTGQPLEMQVNEVVITAPAVADTTKREFEGKMMTNREILSKINSDGGGVSFADGGDIPAKIHTTDCEYKFGGKVVKDTDIAHSLGMNSTLKKGKQHFSSGDTTYDVDAIYNAIKKGKLRLKTKEVETFPMKYPVYDKNYAENHKIDFRKPNGITVRIESGEEVLIDGNHRMNNAYLKGRKTMKTYYIEDPKQIANFTKKNKFKLGGENKMGGHLSSGKSLKQIAEMHNVTLAHINEQLAKGLEVEKEHFADFKERTRVAKDHLVENPNYYTILEKAGLKNGGHILSHHRHSDNLVKDAKSGNTPARDLNNYNDVMDLEADGMVGMESGLAFADGGIAPIDANIEGDSVDIVESDFAKGGVVYDTTKPKIEKVTIKETRFNRASVIGRNASTVSELQQIVSDYIGNSPIEDVDWIKFYVNDSTRGSYYIDLNKGKKNTVKNVNSETVNAQNIKRVIDAKDYLVKNYDWTDFFELGSQTTTTTSKGSTHNKVKSLIFKWKESGMPTEEKLVESTEELYNLLKEAYGLNLEDISVQPLGYQLAIKPKPFLSDGIKKLVLDYSSDLAIKNINKYLYELFPDLNFDKLVRNSSNAPTTSTKTPLTKEELYNSRIWIGDDVNLKKKVIQKLEEIGIPFDITTGKPNANKNIDINIFGYDFVVYEESKEEFDKDIKRKEIFLSDLGIDVTTMGVAPKTSNASTSAKPYELNEVVVKWNNNKETYYSGKELIEALRNIERENNGQNVVYEVIGYDYNKSGGVPVEVETDDTSFVRRNYSDQDIKSKIDNWLDGFDTDKFFSVNQATASVPTSAKPFDFTDTKINVSNNPDLSQKVQKIAFENGWEWENGGGKTIDYNTFNYLYFTKTSISYGNSNSSFNNSPKREITEADIFGSQATASQTPTSSQAPATVKIPVVYQIKIYTTEKNSGTSSVSVARSFEDFFKIIKKLVVTKDEFVDTINLSIFSDDPNIKYGDLSFAVEEQAFDLLTDDEAKENLMDSLSANNQELDFKEFFSKSKVKNVDYVIVKEPRSFPDGEKVYRGSAILPLLKDIYKNSPIEHTKVEIDLVVNAKAEDATLTLTLTGVPSYSDYEINPNDISEQILYGKLKLDWFPEYQWDRLFPLIELLDFYLEDSYLQNYTTKNINELFSKLNSPEVKSSDKEIRLTWFGENGETHNFGAYFTNDATVYYQIDRDNFTLDLLRGKLDDWFYGRLSESYMFPDGQVKAKTPTSNSVVPKTVENSVYNLDLAIQKLEKASSAVVTQYNKEIYDQSLKFLYDTKATYELALKFTPESAFMYERLDILKKLAEIEKKIKNIEDMKKGGTFYMLAKILEKLERGENWKLSEQSQDVITNKLPQSEIDVIIRTQKFKNWFGDWEKALINDEYDNVSKALTDGIPSVYHHGARRIKYTYREVSNGVLYLAENVSYALWFSQNSTAQSEEGNYLTECFVNIKNPIDLTAFQVNKVDLADIVRYVDAVYPMAKIYDFIPAQVALLIRTNQPTNVRIWAWQLIRSYAKFVNHIKENTPYDGFLYYENNPSDEVINPLTGKLEENVTKAVAIFKSHQVKVVDAVLFDGGLDDWRFENGGKTNN